MISQHLLDAYNHTEYHVFDPPFIIRIGEVCVALDDLLQKYHQTEWAFVSAYNPGSNILPDTENAIRHQQLLAALGLFTFFEGEGIGENPPWKPERSLLVIGISRAKAAEFGNTFDQNAIVVGRIHAAAELLLLR